MGDSTTLAELHDKYDEMARCTDEVAFGIRHLRRLICRSDALTPGAGPVAATWPPPDPLVVAGIPLEGYWRLYDPKVFGRIGGSATPTANRFELMTPPPLIRGSSGCRREFVDARLGADGRIPWHVDAESSSSSIPCWLPR